MGLIKGFYYRQRHQNDKQFTLVSPVRTSISISISVSISHKKQCTLVSLVCISISISISIMIMISISIIISASASLSGISISMTNILCYHQRSALSAPPTPAPMPPHCNAQMIFVTSITSSTYYQHSGKISLCECAFGAVHVCIILVFGNTQSCEPMIKS